MERKLVSRFLLARSLEIQRLFVALGQFGPDQCLWWEEM